MTRSIETLMADRSRLLGPNVSTFYRDPLHIVRGEGVWLWDAEGRKYLDCYNNVPHVGHCNPRVVDAICTQARTLNTHTRYLHEGILDYVERLTGTMDAALDSAILTCTGSEANDIALRMAEAVTGKRGIIATDATYHGNTALVSQLSQSNPPTVGFGLGEYFRFVAAPDSDRSPDPDGQAFAAAVVCSTVPVRPTIRSWKYGTYSAMASTVSRSGSTVKKTGVISSAMSWCIISSAVPMTCNSVGQTSGQKV